MGLNDTVCILKFPSPSAAACSLVLKRATSERLNCLGPYLNSLTNPMSLSFREQVILHLLYANNSASSSFSL